MKLKVFQIGVGSFGRYGFEKLVELDNHFEPVDVELVGVCESDFDKLDAAEKFAEANNIDVETFHEVEEMYERAKREEERVMIYDAGPTDTHARHIYDSMRNNFFHLAEKPPSLSREDHLKEKKLAEENDVMWKVDFIERENPAVKKALEIVEGKVIDEIRVFRESSMGVQKVLQPVERIGVKGGDVLDKMVHEAFVLDFLEKAGKEAVMDIEEAETEFFLPKDEGSEKLMALDGGYTEKISLDTATAQTKATFDSYGTEVKLHSSWLGLSEEAQVAAKKIREKTGHKVFNREYSEVDGKAFLDEETRFFVIEGEKNLVGDMLHNKLFDLETGEEIELDTWMHDQLYRVIKKAVLQAAGEEVETISEKETDIFMNAIFDVKEKAAEGDFLEEREKALDKLESMIVADKKVIESNEAETVAG